ncbi:MAG: hypothetical protein Q7R93_03025 [bacterium]|nr:hypothetical protein [bacterium]
MNWKSWPYWKKGATVGLVLGVAVYLFLYSLLASSSFFKPDNFAEFFELSWRLMLIWSLPVFIACVLIGWIWGKLKNRNLNTGSPPSRG